MLTPRGEEGGEQETGDEETDSGTQYVEGQHSPDEGETGQDDGEGQLPVNTLFYGVRGQQVRPACDIRGRGWGTWGAGGGDTFHYCLINARTALSTMDKYIWASRGSQYFVA